MFELKFALERIATNVQCKWGASGVRHDADASLSALRHDAPDSLNYCKT